MNRYLRIFGFCWILALWSSAPIAAQPYTKTIEPDSMLSFNIRLHDNNSKELLDLPVTFQLTNKNILIMLLGNDKELPDYKSVWLFTSVHSVKELLSLNKNVKVTKEFKKRIEFLNPFFLPADGIPKIAFYRKAGLPFDNSCEVVRNKIKPLFFEVLNNAEEVLFDLQCYVAEIDRENPHLQTLIAKAKTVTIKLKIKK